MAVSISDRKWILDVDGVTREKIDFSIDSKADIADLPDPGRISASSVAVIKQTNETIFIVDGAWAGAEAELEQAEV
jgi:hypothetical protein